MNKTRFLLTCLLLAVLMYSLPGCEEKDPPARPVPVSQASNQTREFANLRNDTSRTAERLTAIYYTSEIFSKKDLSALLNQKNCNGVRVYHALDSSGRVILYMVGVDSNNKDLLPPRKTSGQQQTGDEGATNKSDSSSEEYYIIDGTLRCPVMCDGEELPK